MLLSERASGIPWHTTLEFLCSGKLNLDEREAFFDEFVADDQQAALRVWIRWGVLCVAPQVLRAAGCSSSPSRRVIINVLFRRRKLCRVIGAESSCYIAHSDMPSLATKYISLLSKACHLRVSQPMPSKPSFHTQNHNRWHHLATPTHHHRPSGLLLRRSLGALSSSA